MSLSAPDYFNSTRHPWSCALFVLPLLAAYEIGVILLGANESELLRNGADTWMHWLLSETGLPFSFLPGILLGLFLIGWCWWSKADRPKELPNVWIGMAVESIVFAVGLWLFSLALGPCLDKLGFTLQISPQAEPAYYDLVSFLGAGIYEEVLFRLIFFSALFWLFVLGEMPAPAPMLLATLISSMAFAAAHHIGPAGEPFDGYVFLFRSIAGAFFAVVYRLRGFGVVVGAHTAYDVLVGVLLH